MLPWCPSPTCAQLRSIVDTAPDGIFIADTDGRYTFVNDAGCRLLGRSSREIVGMRIEELIPDEDVSRLADSKARMLCGQTDIGEWRLRRGDGTWVPVEVHAQILYDGQWQGFVRDISGRTAKEAEREALLADSEAQRRWWQSVIDALPVAVILYEPSGRIACNSRAEQLLSMTLSPEGGSLQYASRILFPDGTPVPYERLVSQRVLRDEQTIVAEEYIIVQPDGTRTPILGSAAPIRDSQGQMLGAVGVFQDVSERMRLDQAVRENERLLQGIFDLLPVGVWVADREGRITLANPAGERIWRGTRFVGPSHFHEYVAWWADSGKPVASHEWGLARAIEHGETARGQLLRIRAFDGTLKTIINWAAPIRSEQDEIVGAVAVNEDVTPLQQAHDQLQAAVRDREEILAIVAHDLRNPLQGIILDASLLQLASAEGGEHVSELAHTIAEAARRMAGLVDDLLAVAVKRAAGESMLELDLVPASMLLEKAAKAARSSFAKAHVNLEIERTEELPAVSVDLDRMLRVFANLLDNACKYTSPGGHVKLSARTTSDGVLFYVSNSGEPLEPQQLETMFQPFWQAQRHRSGAGLGLSICRQIVEEHGGRIWAEPAAGARVQVMFVLPRQDVRAEQLVSVATSGVAVRPKSNTSV